MIKGISHITLSVKSLSVSFDFYQNILGFKPLMKSQRSAYFLAGDLWFCIEEDQAVRSGALPEYTHIAFSIGPSDFPSTAAKVREAGVEIFKENKSEGDSLYFLDPDGHKLEIHVGTWETRLQVYKEKTPDGMQFFV